MAEDRPARSTTWRRVSGTGGAVLALSVFLPAVHACNSDVVPAEELSRLSSSSSLIDLATTLVIYLVPYLFGLMVALAAGLVARSAQRVLRVALFGVLAATITTLTAGIVRDAMDDRLDPAQVALLLPLVLSAVYAMRAARRGEGGALCLRWYAAILCLAWFGTWLVSVSALYGLVLSFLGSAGVAAGAAGELHARTGLGLGALLRKLATASVELPPARGP